MALKNNTWKINQWYDQAVAGNVDYNGAAAERTQLYVWGANAYGTLGLNAQGGWSEYLTAQSSPIQITGTWGSFSTGSNNSGGVKADGTLWTWGRNHEGQLGINDIVDRSSPVQVGTDTDWSTIIGANGIGYCVKTNGTLWVWGQNYNGKLGLNQPAGTHYSSPVQLPGTWSTDTRKFRSSNYHNIAIKSDGTLWSWGSNQYGQLGLNTSGSAGSSADRFSSPVQIPGTTWNSCIAGYFWSAATKTDGTLWAIGGANGPGALGQNNNTYYSSPVQIPGTTWSKVLGGYSGIYGIKTDGTLWSWGVTTALNLYGPAARFSSPVQIPGTTWSDLTGSSSFMATKTDGTLWAWGNNEAGQNAQNDRGGYDNLWGPLLSRSSPTQVPGGWKIDTVNMSGGPGGRQFGALKS